MAGKPYSTRFLQHTANGYSGQWFVPAGHRAVIKSVIANNGVAAAVNIIALIDGVTVYTFSMPGYGGAASQPLMYVCYAGQGLQLYNGGNAIVSSMHGFLLADT